MKNNFKDKEEKSLLEGSLVCTMNFKKRGNLLGIQMLGLLTSL